MVETSSLNNYNVEKLFITAAKTLIGKHISSIVREEQNLR
jgi:hypothetical protein